MEDHECGVTVWAAYSIVSRVGVTMRGSKSIEWTEFRVQSTSADIFGILREFRPLRLVRCDRPQWLAIRKGSLGGEGANDLG